VLAAVKLACAKVLAKSERYSLGGIQIERVSQDFDVVIVGGGPVGLAIALALSRHQLAVGLIEKEPAAGGASEDAWDARVYAISPGSEAFLRELQAWPQDESRHAAVTRMSIYGDRPGSALEFDAQASHVPRLATILEYSRLLQGLQTALASTRVQTFSPAECASVELTPQWGELTLTDGQVLRAKLLIAADGADSWLRQAAGIGASKLDYAQTGVVANFETNIPHGGTAFQWFDPKGVLALLPLPGDRVSMVWSIDDDLAAGLLTSAPQELERAVESASHSVVGNLRLLAPARGFPLRLIRVSKLVGPRLALVGDAAHNLHPLAGQGINLGFSDVNLLASVLGARGPCRDVGALPLLRRYERGRREDILAMTAATHGLQRLFNNSVASVARARNLGLDLTNRMGPIKSLLVRHAMGKPIYPY